MRKKSHRFLEVVKHFHTLLAVMTGTVVAALLVPLLCRLVAMRIPEAEFISRFLAGGESNPTAGAFHYLYSLSILQGAGLCLIPCAIVNMPFIYAAYRKGCEASIPF